MSVQNPSRFFQTPFTGITPDTRSDTDGFSGGSLGALLTQLGFTDADVAPLSTAVFGGQANESENNTWQFGASNAFFDSDHFDFIPEADPESEPVADSDDPESPALVDVVSFDETLVIGTASAGDGGRPDPGDPGPSPDPTPAEDTDPDAPPPPPPPPEEPAEPTEAGRPPGTTPGVPGDTPPTVEPVGNEEHGRPEDAEPDPGPDTGVVDTYTSGGPSGSSYNVTVDFIGTWTAELQAAFIEAADYLSSIVLADLPDAIVDGMAVDDITITATLEYIDGVGGTLGSAGPRALRDDGTYLPATGAMRFDSDDAANQLNLGNWETIVLHEMMHAMGFGTLWSLMGLTSGSVSGGDIRFTGVNATDTYQTEFSGIAGSDPGSASGVPVEADGGPGTAGGHWDEVLFDTEIMTGYVDTGSFVSVMTIAALEDMGYDTVFDNPYSASDQFGPIPADPLMDLMA